jgi:hypothetical protein
LTGVDHSLETDHHCHVDHLQLAQEEVISDNGPEPQTVGMIAVIDPPQDQVLRLGEDALHHHTIANQTDHLVGLPPATLDVRRPMFILTGSLLHTLLREIRELVHLPELGLPLHSDPDHPTHSVHAPLLLALDLLQISELDHPQ